MSHSTRYAIGQALKALIVQVAASNTAAALFNPKLPLDTKACGQRVLFLLDRGDRLIEQPGQKEKRRCRFVLGALVGGNSADADADELHFAARSGIKAARAALHPDCHGPVREVEVEPELKDIGAEGALLLSAYEIDYLQVYPATT